jgi:tudor domain-containing protein 1/4/6/7
MTDIEVSMMTDKTRPTSISEGDIGLVCVSECWSRVRIEKIRQDLMCQCFDIDQGDVEVYPIEVIYVCEPRFLELPAQVSVKMTILLL